MLHTAQKPWWSLGFTHSCNNVGVYIVLGGRDYSQTCWLLLEIPSLWMKIKSQLLSSNLI
jgi:hypothetical protein